MDEEIVKLQTELISEREFQKLRNQFEAQYVSSNSRVQGIASSLASYYMLQGGTDRINKELDMYNSITREDIMEAANKYLKPNQRLELDYLAGSAPTEEEMMAAKEMEDIKIVDNKMQVKTIYFEDDKLDLQALGDLVLKNRRSE